MVDNLILVATGLAALLLAEFIYYVVRYAGERKRAELRRRLQTLAEPGSVPLLRERRMASTEAMDGFLRRLPFTEKLEELLLQTDYSWRVSTILVWSVVAAGVATAGLFVVVGDGNPTLAAIGIPIGLAAPTIAVFVARDRRSTKISEQMPEALDMMVRSLRAGHGISSGFKLVASEMPPPIAVEFGRCFEENNAGAEFRDAIQNMAARVPGNLDLKIFAVSIVIQHETGGDLVEILEQISHIIRERYKFYGKLAALTAEGKVSGTILGALPFVTAIAIATMNPKYLGTLLVDPMGKMFILAGAALWLWGVLWLRSLARVEY